MIIDRYVPIWGGSENQLRQLIPHLIPFNCSVTVLTRRWHKEMLPKEDVEGTNVYRVGLPGRTIFMTVAYICGLIHFSFRHRKSIDIIHTHGAAALGAMGFFLGWFIRKPNIAKIASSRRIPELKKHIFGLMILHFLKKSDIIISLSHEINKELKDLHVPSNKIRDIKNGVDILRFQPATGQQRNSWKTQRGWKGTDPIIIFAGRFVSIKGPDILINAWPTIVKAHPNARLILLGSGRDQSDSIEQLLREKIIDEKIQNVYLEGETNTPEDYFKLANIFVMPSKREGIPNVLLEAMASGLATVGTKIGGIADLIEDQKRGILIPYRDEKNLAQAIIFLLNNPEKQESFGNQAREYVVEHLTFDKIAQQYFDTYTYLLREKS